MSVHSRFRSMPRGLLALAAGAFLLLSVGCGYGHNHYRGGYPGYYGGGHGYSDDAFQLGFRDGLRHGAEDRREGLDFNFEHDRRFQNGISYDRYVNQQYRDGYVKGYQQGYYGGRY
jgi:hypothetical protein